MTITRRGNSFQVEVRRVDALDETPSGGKNYRRIRKSVASRQDAVELEKQVHQALDKFGKWPVPRGCKPLHKPTPRNRISGGTLREAAKLAFKTHWRGTSQSGTRGIEATVWTIVSFMETKRKVFDLDDLTSADIDAYSDHCMAPREQGGRGNVARTVQKNLTFLSVIFDVAMERTPPLAVSKPNIKKPKPKKVLKWWLTPEMQGRVVTHLKAQGDELMADYVELAVFLGLRVEENLRLEPKHFSGLNGERPTCLVPGTKTANSQQTIGVHDDAARVARRCVSRAEANGWKTLFPWNYKTIMTKWQDIRSFLNEDGNTSCTLKALRRSFAAYANARGVKTHGIQRHLRHSSITTTEGYLALTGNDTTEMVRDQLNTRPASSQTHDLVSVLEAYRSTGATPEECAKFAKEMMA